MICRTQLGRDRLQFEFAPMEGITDDLFRRLHHKYFPGISRYYTPFLSPSSSRTFSKKELRDVLPENNREIHLIPQLLTNQSEQFLAGAKVLKDLGYQEVNLNLGCPSGTVTAKGKGSGFLFPEQRHKLIDFLDKIFEQCPIAISIKTRLGKATPEEFEVLLELYNRYPIRLLIVHPRVQQDFYRKPIQIDWFFWAMERSKNPLCLSGGIAIPSDFDRIFANKEPPQTIMLGRGLVADPTLVQKLQGNFQLSRETLYAFHEELFQETAIRLGSIRNTMFRMKEFWSYFILLFDQREKDQKILRKTTSLTEYQAVTTHILKELPLREYAEPNWV